MISPLCLEAVRRIDRLFGIERDINGCSADQRRTVRQQVSAPLVADLHAWMREQRATLSGASDTAKAMDYMLKRWPVLALLSNFGPGVECWPILAHLRSRNLRFA
jgi:hypothetical protein